MTDETCKHHLAYAEHLERIDSRLAEADCEIDTMKDCVARLTVIQEEMREQSKILEQTRREQQKDIEARLRALESAKGRRLDQMMGYALSAIIGGIAVFILKTVGIC